jgi:phage-related protein
MNMLETFNWAPDSRPSARFQHQVRSAKFGDGYEQVAADGINSETQSWQLSFTGSKERTREILDFLRARKGYQSFYWTPPFAEKMLFRCTEYAPAELGGGQWSISATFNQSFHP